MASFDPLQKLETWVFQQVKSDDQGRPVYRRCNYNYVQYDGNPDRFIEPRSLSERIDFLSCQIYTAKTDGGGPVVGFEYVTSRPYEVHSFDDVDLSQL